MKPNKIAVIGGTGKSGKYLVKRLIHEQFSLKVLSRNTSNLPDYPPSVEVVEGDARDYGSILKLVQGCDAVISTLGQPKDEPSIFSQATKNVVQAMTECGIKRYIVTTGLHVDTPLDIKDPKVQFATRWMYENFQEVTEDKQNEYEFLTGVQIDWTLVRLPLIIQTDEQINMEASLENCDGENISATDLGRFLVDQLRDRTYIRKSPFLFNL